ncbi:organic hydroperoxide resistance protein [Actinoplanes sp. NPDC051851]|uniref:organic hydroperoxide resistance protein n=1 Tax=Actinoplanes sp. NPDC051851 TaxID=3154753 RepID=UPI0034320676
MAALYTASATATGDGRNGRTRTSDGVLDLELALPKEMGGPGGHLPNPEQLFAAGYAACFHSALKLVAGKRGVPLVDSAVVVEVGIGPDGQGGFGLSAAVEAQIPGLDAATASGLVEAAHQVCPYSNAVRGNIEVTVSVA